MGLRAVLAAVAGMHQGLSAEPITIDPDGVSRCVEAIPYSERTEWRSSDRGRERVVVRDVILPAGDPADVGTTVVIDSTRYTIERFLTAESGRRKVTCRRVSTTERSRPGYRGNI